MAFFLCTFEAPGVVIQERRRERESCWNGPVFSYDLNVQQLNI